MPTDPFSSGFSPGYEHTDKTSTGDSTPVPEDAVATPPDPMPKDPVPMPPLMRMPHMGRRRILVMLDQVDLEEDDLLIAMLLEGLHPEMFV